tara:strand:- start:3788 stop:4006 length:219 start_codon:yes stop_codon:yes gene_type:complete
MMSEQLSNPNNIGLLSAVSISMMCSRLKAKAFRLHCPFGGIAITISQSTSGVSEFGEPINPLWLAFVYPRVD